jgi:hypothetical protein
MNPTLTEGGPLWVMGLLVLAAWAGLFVKLWLETRAPRPRYRREGRHLDINLMATNRKRRR